MNVEIFDNIKRNCRNILDGYAQYFNIPIFENDMNKLVDACVNLPGAWLREAVLRLSISDITKVEQEMIKIKKEINPNNIDDIQKKQLEEINMASSILKEI